MKQTFSFGKIAQIAVSILLVLLLIPGFFTIKMIFRVQSYGKLINYVGIVRGATQRLVKLETNGTASDELRVYLDDIWVELISGEGPIGLVRISDPAYNKDLEQLQIMWGEVKTSIDEVRAGADPAKLLALSEEYFLVANQTVFDAEIYSNSETKKLTQLIVLLFVSIVLIVALTLFSGIRRLFALKKHTERLEEVAYRDNLTGAYNLDKFKLDAPRLIKKMADVKFAVFYVDFENFKSVNDIFGYSFGDEILKQYANMLQIDINDGEIFCRVTADRFVILRAYTGSREEVLERQAVVDGEILSYSQNSKESHFLSISCGICCTEDVVETLDIDGLIERANFARNTVKGKSLSHYAFYNEEIRSKMRAEATMENRMHAALQAGEFQIYLQPKVCLKTNEIACAEALVRWFLPEGGMVSPGEFIPLFERNLFIILLDQYVFEQVCIWLSARIDAGEKIVPVSVNVSPMQLYDGNFVKNYAEIKNKYNIPDNLLEVEFTESVVFEDLTVLLRIITELHVNGFKCALDDFGKGYSSLNLMKNLPMDVLKLDGLFFDDEENIARARCVVKGVVELLQSLEIKIVAEGVERKDQVEFLRSIGCDLVQGYVFYRPMPLDKINELLDNTL